MQKHHLLQHFGRVVYAGGDDVFALTTKADLLSTMNSVRKEFKNTLSSNNSKYKSITGNFSMSAGAVVAHYKAPLFQVLDEVRLMEHKAKAFILNNELKKNSCALMALSHGGNNKYTIFPWEFLDEVKNEVVEVIPVLEEIKDLLKEDTLSKAFIYTLREEFEPLLNAEGELVAKNAVSREIFKSEFKRIVLRALIDQTMKSNIIELVERLLRFWEYGMKLNVRYFLSFLEIASIMNRRNV